MAATLDDIVYELQVNRGYLAAIEHAAKDGLEASHRAVGGAAASGHAGHGLFGAINAGIDTAGVAGQQLARNNVFGLAATGLKTAQRISASVGSKINKVGSGGERVGFGGASGGIGGAALSVANSAIGQLAGSSAKAVTALGILVEAFKVRASELARFSPDIIRAQVGANIKNLQADMREARELGPGMGRMITAENDITIEIRDILLPIRKFVVGALAGSLEGILDYIRYLKTVLAPEVFGFFVEVIDLLNKIKPGADIAQDIKKTLQRIAQELRDMKDPKKDPTIWDMVEKNEGMRMMPAAPAAVPGFGRAAGLGGAVAFPGL